MATLTVSDWADVHLNGSYLFRIEYTGENVMTVKHGEVEVVPADDNKNAQKLPKYDQQGRLYLSLIHIWSTISLSVIRPSKQPLQSHTGTRPILFFFISAAADVTGAPLLMKHTLVDISSFTVIF